MPGVDARVSVEFADIEAAGRRLLGYALRTPLLRNRVLDERSGARVLIKCENLQHIGAFKFRGAYNRLCQLDAAQKRRGVVAFSSGNHAQGVALAARMLGMEAIIVMPSDAPQTKIDGTRALGAKIRLYDRQRESREEIAAALAQDTGAVLVPAFDDPQVIAGQGTCGIELVEQARGLGLEPDLILCPVGGGGLIAGVATAAKALLPGILVRGVEPQQFDDHRRSRLAGSRQRVAAGASSICDALLAPMPGEITWEINRRRVDDFLAVTDAEVARAVSFAFRHLKLVLEPGGAVALAALLSGNGGGGVVCIVLSGGNIDRDVFCRCLAENPDP